MHLNSNEQKHLERLINYVETDEQRHYDELNQPSDHIYNSIKVIKRKFNKSSVIKY